MQDVCLDVCNSYSNLQWYFNCFVLSETTSQLQRRNVSFKIPNTEDGKKHVWAQSQLLDGMLLWVVGCHMTAFLIYFPLSNHKFWYVIYSGTVMAPGEPHAAVIV